jgi:hypothetical protein
LLAALKQQPRYLLDEQRHTPGASRDILYHRGQFLKFPPTG